MVHHIHPKKALGQHFLADANIARNIAGSLTGHGDYKVVIEVGPGTGMLSRFLINNKDYRWVGLEVDREAIAYLQERFHDFKDNIIEADFLRADLQQFSQDGQLAVIGNFPYNISSQILFRVLHMRLQIPEMVGMFQKEVARRIASPPGSKEYGILSVLTQAFYDVEILFNVEPHVFVPPPKVQSSVIRCRRKIKSSLDCDEKMFFTVVKTAFNQRRKTLRNSLKGMDICWDKLPAGLHGKRPEQLGVFDFVAITNRAKSACQAS